MHQPTYTAPPLPASQLQKTLGVGVPRHPHSLQARGGRVPPTGMESAPWQRGPAKGARGGAEAVATPGTHKSRVGRRGTRGSQQRGPGWHIPSLSSPKDQK